MLSKGAIKQIVRAGEKQPFNAQILQIKGVVGQNSSVPTRYRLLLTDGVEQIAAICGSQLNESIANNTFVAFSVVKVTNFSTNTIQDQQVLIIVNMELVAHVGKQIPEFMIEMDGYKTLSSMGMTALPSAQATQVPMTATNSYQQPAPVSNPYQQPSSNNPYQQQAGNLYQQQVPAPAYNPYGSTGIAAPAGGSSYDSYAAASGGNTRPIMRVEAAVSETIVPIAAINPYSNRCTIKARITSKSEIKRWQNAKGEGTLFSVDLLDAAGSAIRGTFFKETCEKFYPVLAEGKVYTFTGFKTKLVTNKQFSSIKNNYEITFDVMSDIRAVNDDAAIKSQNYSFIKIGSIPNVEKDATVDVLAIVRHAGDVSEIISQKMGGKKLLKRDLTLVDDTLSEIRLTLWGEKAEQAVDWNAGPIVAFKGVRVGDFGGRSLSVSQSSSVAINPNIPEAFALHQWRESTGGVIPTAVSLSAGGMEGGGGAAVPFDQRKLVSAIKEEGLGAQEKPDYITVKGTISYIKHDNDPWYTACPTPGCNKKVIESMSGSYNCEKCNMSFPECQRRYILSLVMTDASGNNWFSLFNDAAEILLQCSAQTVFQMKQEGNEAGANKVFKDALFKTYIAKVRVKQENVQDEMRVKSTAVTLSPLDYVQECKYLLEAIGKYK